MVSWDWRYAYLAAGVSMVMQSFQRERGAPTPSSVRRRLAVVAAQLLLPLQQPQLSVPAPVFPVRLIP